MKNHFTYPIEATIGDIEWLRRDLGVIMAFAGWSCEALSAMLGVTRTTVSRIKNRKGHMNITQYLAICHLIDNECRNNKALREALNIMNGYGEYNMTREELVEHCTVIVKSTGRRLGVNYIKDRLRDWLLNDGIKSS